MSLDDKIKTLPDGPYKTFRDYFQDMKAFSDSERLLIGRMREIWHLNQKKKYQDQLLGRLKHDDLAHGAAKMFLRGHPPKTICKTLNVTEDELHNISRRIWKKMITIYTEVDRERRRR